MEKTELTNAQKQNRVRQRISQASIDPDKYEYIPAKEQNDHVKADQYQRVAIYARVSTDNPMQTTSFELQQKYYEELVAQHPQWVLVKIYADEGKSGTTMQHRDGFNEMLADADAGKIDLIIVKNISRFARNVVDCLSIIRKLSEKKIGVNTACVRLMPDVEYVQILVNRKEKKLLLKPCDEIEITGYRWGKTKEGKRYPAQRTGELFVLTICELMDWNPDYRYKVLGKMVQANGKALIAFDLTSSECFPKVVNQDGKKVSSRQSVFAEQWSGKFGPTYSESRRSLAVKTFDNYTVITVNGKKTEVHPQAQSPQQGSMGDPL